MAEVDINVLLKSYDDEIGRLNGEIIRQRAAYEAQLAELTKSFADAQVLEAEVLTD